MSCIITAAMRHDGPGDTSTLAWAAAFLAVFGVINILCSEFIGGFTRNGSYRMRVADSPQLQGDEIFRFLGWLFLFASAAMIGWLYWK
jgi:hypothetical protein